MQLIGRLIYDSLAQQVKIGPIALMVRLGSLEISYDSHPSGEWYIMGVAGYVAEADESDSSVPARHRVKVKPIYFQSFSVYAKREDS